MSNARNKFLAYAKIYSSRLAYQYAIKKNNGFDVSNLLDQLILVDSYIQAIEDYEEVCKCTFYYQGILTTDCGCKVYMSPNNSLLLESETKKVYLNPDDVNCLSEKNICEIVNRLKAIFRNC